MFDKSKIEDRVEIYRLVIHTIVITIIIYIIQHTHTYNGEDINVVSKRYIHIVRENKDEIRCLIFLL